jgi:hypothetical protein
MMFDFKGKNSLDTGDLLKERVLFEDSMLTLPVKFENISLYGRYDEDGNVVVPNEQRLSGIPGSNVKVLDFVQNAYTDFLKLMEKAKRRGFKSEIFVDLTPKEGYTDSKGHYFSFFNTIHSQFVVNYINRRKNKRNIVDFFEYCEEFVQFFLKLSDFPITRAGYLESNLVSNSLTGLFVTIEKKDGSNDEIKNKYFNDPSFDFFVRSLRYFGFSIDGVVPWRFVFDIKSPAAVDYLALNQTDSDKLFQTHFRPVEDIFEFASFLRVSYQSFVGSYPHYTENKRMILRNPDVFSLDNEYFIRMYLFFRVKEKNYQMSQSEFETTYKNIIATAGLDGTNQTIRKEILTLNRTKSRMGINRLVW